MAQDQSALSDLLESLRSADGSQLMNRLLAGALQALIDCESAEVIGAGRPLAGAFPYVFADATYCKVRSVSMGANGNHPTCRWTFAL